MIDPMVQDVLFSDMAKVRCESAKLVPSQGSVLPALPRDFDGSSLCDRADPGDPLHTSIDEPHVFKKPTLTRIQ
jgi:hypothetical protein